MTPLFPRRRNDLGDYRKDLNNCIMYPSTYSFKRSTRNRTSFTNDMHIIINSSIQHSDRSLLCSGFVATNKGRRLTSKRTAGRSQDIYIPPKRSNAFQSNFRPMSSTQFDFSFQYKPFMIFQPRNDFLAFTTLLTFLKYDQIFPWISTWDLEIY